MNIICTILLTINVGKIPFIQYEDTEGTILKESNTKYLVDFSEGVKNFNITGKPENYSKVLVDKEKCVKL